MNTKHEPVGAISASRTAPHYFEFRGKVMHLLTSAEHYGAVINRAFDYVAYFDALHKYGLNYTRIYPGGYFEIPGYFVPENVLGPEPEDLILPWARSEVPGYSLGGNKFDLGKWDEEYFDRLEDFIAQASKREIVVEICFFNCMYPDIWPHMPLNAANNIQGIGTGSSEDYQTLADPMLNLHQEAYVRELTRRTNAHDNVILEIDDEPTLHGTRDDRAARWISRLIDAVIDVEVDLPNKHLITQQVMTAIGGPLDFSADPRIGMATGQYIWRDLGNQIGGMALLDAAWHLDKPIELNETSFFPNWYEEGDRVAAVRCEAWEFIVGGGAGYNHLSSDYKVKNPGAVGTLTSDVGQMLKNLRSFIESFDFPRMQPWQPRTRTPDDGFWRGLAEEGRQYALYLHHSKLVGRQRYVPTFGNYEQDIEMFVPSGTYQLEWIDPSDLSTIERATLTHTGGMMNVKTPPHKMDIALRMTNSAL